MQSWLRRKTSSSGGSSPLLGKDKKKEDKETANLTPLERMLHESGKNDQPVQEDGNDKFFGMENFGNTCYANSILQSLYFSEPFREEVISYPKRAPIDTVLNGPDGQPRPIVKITPQSTLPQNKQKNPASPATARTPTKPEDKNSAEYKKKQALIKGPVVPMDYDNSDNYGMKESLFTSLKDIFEGIMANKNRMGVIRPLKLIDILKKERIEFNSGQHQDAHEFLNLLLNSVNDTVEADAKARADEQADGAAAVKHALAQAKANAHANGHAVGSSAHFGPSFQWVNDLFQGTLTSETVCLTCEKVSHRDEPFIDLSVDIEQHSSVTACLRQFSEEEMLCERDKFSCDNCGYTEAQKRMKVKRLPRILALHLKRFKAVDMDGWRFQKLFHRVVYPFHLRLFNTTDNVEDPDKIYELYAVVIHIGAGLFQGHYVSVVKTKEAGWVLFDDELVEPVKQEFVQNFFGDRPGQAAAYVLFYQETTQEKVNAEQARNATPQPMPRTPVSMPLKSPGFGLGLGLASPILNGTKANVGGLQVPAEADEVEGEKLARVQTASPYLDPVSSNASTAASPMVGIEHAKTATDHPQPNGTLSALASAPPPKTGGFLGRMRRSSKSGKRSNFFGSLDLTKEGRMRDVPPSGLTNGVSNHIPDTSGEETPKPVVNGTSARSEMSFPLTEESPATSTTQLYTPQAQPMEQQPLQSQTQQQQQQPAEEPEPQASSTKKRFLSIRRKATEKTNNLRKSTSKGNILSFRKDDKTDG